MKTLLSILLITAPSLVFAADSAKEETCKVRDVASLNYMENIKSSEDVDVGAIYQEKTEQLLAFAKNFSILVYSKIKSSVLWIYFFILFI